MQFDIKYENKKNYLYNYDNIYYLTSYETKRKFDKKKTLLIMNS